MCLTEGVGIGSAASLETELYGRANLGGEICPVFSYERD